MTFTQYEKGGVVSQKWMFNVQQGHVPVRLHDLLGSLVCAKGLITAQFCRFFFCGKHFALYGCLHGIRVVSWLQLPGRSLFPQHSHGKRDLSHKATLGTKAFRKGITM